MDKNYNNEEIKGENKKEKVSIVKCYSYKNKEVSCALRKIISDLNLDLTKLKNKKILIKPNLLLPCKPEDAITTNPVIIEELCKILKKHKCEIFIGDSSSHDTSESIKLCGMNKLKKYAKIINFDNEKKIKLEVRTKDNKINDIYLPEITKKVDFIINMAKLKTHSLTKMTCCVKNMYGCIPGNTKEYYHRLFPNENDFSNMLLDVYSCVKPDLCIIDGVVGLEGDGPGFSGKKKKANLIIGSKDSIAADIIASRIIGFKENEVLTNKYALKKGLFNKKIEIIGKLENMNFKRPHSNIAGFFTRFVVLLPKPKLKFDYNRCIKCGLCCEKCPSDAIKMHDYPIWDNKKCIRCLCCVEVCPKAVISKELGFIEKFLRNMHALIAKKNRQE